MNLPVPRLQPCLVSQLYHCSCISAEVLHTQKGSCQNPVHLLWLALLFCLPDSTSPLCLMYLSFKCPLMGMYPTWIGHHGGLCNMDLFSLMVTDHRVFFGGWVIYYESLTWHFWQTISLLKSQWSLSLLIPSWRRKRRRRNPQESFYITVRPRDGRNTLRMSQSSGRKYAFLDHLCLNVYCSFILLLLSQDLEKCLIFGSLP